MIECVDELEMPRYTASPRLIWAFAKDLILLVCLKCLNMCHFMGI